MFQDHDHDHDYDHGDLGGGEWDDEPSTLDYAAPLLKTTLDLFPISENARSAATTLVDEAAGAWRQRRREQRAADRAAAAERRAEEARREADRKARQASLDDLQETIREGQEARERLEEHRQREIQEALRRGAAAEATLAAQANEHWVVKMVLADGHTRARQLLATIEMAEELGTSREQLEELLRRHLAEQAVSCSELTVGLLRAVLAVHRERDEPTGGRPTTQTGSETNGQD